MKNTYKVLGAAGAAGLAAYLSFVPLNAEAFYVSQKEAQKAGISRKDITKDKQPMGDTVSYKGTLEDKETFNDIAERLNNWAQDFFGTELSEQRTKDVLAEFNSYKKVEMPDIKVPCKYQFTLNYVKRLEKEIEKAGKPGYTEKDLEFLKGKLHELEELYEQDITELKEKYNDHEKRIEELESRPEQGDYSREIEDLRKENRELREMIEGMEGGYAQPPAGEAGEYDQPTVEGYTNGGEVVYGQPGWFIGLPDTYIILGGSVYYREYFGDTFRWRHWGWVDFYDGFYYARGLDGGIHYYRGPERYMPLFRHHKDHHRPDTRPWDHGKGRVIHPRDHHRRDLCEPERHRRERSGDRGRRFEGSDRRELPRGDSRDSRLGRQFSQGRTVHHGQQRPQGNFQRPHFNQPGQGRTEPRRFQHGNVFQRPHANPQFSQPRGGFQQPQNFRNPGGRGFQSPGSHIPRRGGRQ